MRKTYVTFAGLVLAAAAAYGAGCASAPTAKSLPPAVVEPGTFVWYDLMTDNSEASREFYKGMFGWKFEQVTRMSQPYYLIKTSDGNYIGGVASIQKRGDQRGSQWLSYLSVASVERAVASTTGVGGRLFGGPVDLPVGTVAVLADPQGALVGVAHLKLELPAKAAARPGHFFWTEYLAADDKKALGFYRDLVGFEAEVTETAGGLSYHVLKTGGPRAGLVRIPEQAQQVRPNWLPYVMVEDPAMMANRAQHLGGSVLLAPGPQARKGTVTIVADPTGAALALQKWPM